MKSCSTIPDILDILLNENYKRQNHNKCNQNLPLLSCVRAHTEENVKYDSDTVLLIAPLE